jgi:hypothetical protein
MPSWNRWISLTELRLAFRLLRKQPVATITTVLALTVGIGMATTGFTLLDSVLYSKLPFPNGDRFVLLDVYKQPEAQRTGLDSARFQFFARTGVSLRAPRCVSRHRSQSGAAVERNRARQRRGPDARLHPSLSYAPIIGRMLRAQDGVPGASPVMLLRASLWRRHF